MILPMIAASMTLLVMKAAIVESPGMIDGMMNFHVSQPDVTIMINAISAFVLIDDVHDSLGHSDSLGL